MQDVKKFNNTDWEKGVRGMRAQRSGSKRGFMCSVKMGSDFLCFNSLMINYIDLRLIQRLFTI